MGYLKKNNDKETEATASLINDEFDKFLKLGRLKSVIKLNFFAPSLHGCKKINEKTLVPETWYNRLA